MSDNMNHDNLQGRIDNLRISQSQSTVPENNKLNFEVSTNTTLYSIVFRLTLIHEFTFSQSYLVSKSLF